MVTPKRFGLATDFFLADQKLNIQRKIEYSNGMKIHEYTFSQPVSQPDLESGSIFTKV